jgi:hypothetical protein
MMYDHDESTTFWVSPEGSDKGPGTFDEPYASIAHALERVRPGHTIVLKEGEYRGDVTVQVSGIMRRPIRILAHEGARVEVRQSSWFFYDVSDLIVSGITFRGAPNVAVSVIGRCERNSFRDLRFISGEATGKVPCTMYFGGSGARHNVVERCRFEVPSDSELEKGRIGIMIAEGDDQHGAMPNTKHLFRRNVFVNYGCGIMVGSRHVPGSTYGHLVEDNVVEGRGGDGIRVRCGDTIVRGNRLSGCGGVGIAVIAGYGSTIEDNRIVECGTGIRVAGMGHSVRNNLLLRCRREALHAAASEEDRRSTNTVVESNTCVDCGTGGVAGVRLDSSAGCIMRKNLFYGAGRPYRRESERGDGRQRRGAETLFVDDNLTGGGCAAAAGCTGITFAFVDPARDNFANESGYGAGGWAVHGAGRESVTDTRGSLHAGNDEEDESAVDRLLTEVDRDELVDRSLFFGDDEGFLDEE